MSTEETHYINRSGWLRASILGANDGILSTASIIIGVAAATSNTRDSFVLAGVAGLVAGALAMAAGEYVSVSSQTDIETADLERERLELLSHPEEELQELVEIYIDRGLDPDLALKVAQQLTEHDALGAHAREELGINEISEAKPLAAALASGAAFIMGGLLPVLVALFLPIETMFYSQYFFSILFLILLGIVSAKVGGSKVISAVIRITLWGTIAMVVSGLIGYIFNVNIA